MITITTLSYILIHDLTVTLTFSGTPLSYIGAIIIHAGNLIMFNILYAYISILYAYNV